MKSIINAGFYGFWIAVIGVFIFGFFYAKDLLRCYDESVMATDTIESSSLSYGWDKYKVCLGKHETIGKLGICVKNAESSSYIPAQLKPQIVHLLSSLRHDVQSIEARKSSHDIECGEYPSTKFDNSDQ
jgi:hypothetical protein